MVDYNQQLDKLFLEWENASGSKSKRLFHRDGLMHKGEDFKHKNGHWGCKKGNENQLWHDAPRRILFLMKDPNKNPGGDIRGWNGFPRHGKRITGKFFTNISLWLYGLNAMRQMGNSHSFPKQVSFVCGRQHSNDFRWQLSMSRKNREVQEYQMERLETTTSKKMAEMRST